MAAAMALSRCVFSTDCAENWCRERIHRELGRRGPDERARDPGRASGTHSSVNLFLLFGYFLRDYGRGNSFVFCASMYQADCRQQCPLVQDLNRHRLASNPPTSSLASEIFSVLFPGTPAVNALLATLYISGPPSLSFTLSMIMYQL